MDENQIERNARINSIALQVRTKLKDENWDFRWMRDNGIEFRQMIMKEGAIDQYEVARVILAVTELIVQEKLPLPNVFTKPELRFEDDYNF